MNSIFLCPHCSLSIEAGPELFGVRCACPECSQEFEVPFPSALSAGEVELSVVLGEKADLEQRLLAANQEQEVLRQEIESRTAERDSAIEKAATLEAAAKHANQELSERVAALTAELGALKTAGEQGKFAQQDSERLKEQLQRSVSEAADLRQRFEQECKALESERDRALDRANTVHAAGQRESAEIKAKLEAIQAELAAAKAAVEQGQLVLRERDTAIAEISRAKEELEVQLNANLRERDEPVPSRIPQLEAEVARLLSVADSSQEEARKLKVQVESLSLERNRLQERVQGLNAEKSAAEPTPETWNYSPNQRQGKASQDRLLGGVWGCFAGGIAAAIGVYSLIPFLIQRSPDLAKRSGLSYTAAVISKDLAGQPGSESKEGVARVPTAPEPAPTLPEPEGLSAKKENTGTVVMARKDAAATGAENIPQPSINSFQGIPLGANITDLFENKNNGPWKETNGRLHRKVDLAGKAVEAVLLPDQDRRLILGAYVRICSKQTSDLAPFLEWAVSVQDAVTAQWGEPSSIHQVSGVSDTDEVVAKIAEGEEYYQVIWDKADKDVQATLSIRSLNERSVAFRLEFKSLKLSQQYLDKTKPSTPDK